MPTSVLKDIMISTDQLDKYFDGSVPVHLWRALNLQRDAHPFELFEEPATLSNGRPRPADIKIEVVNGQKWVRISERPRGLSTFDRPGVPSGKDWKYFKIRKGTVLPYGLAIVKDEYNTRYGTTHYTIAPAFEMPLAHFKSLLSRLASALMREAM